MNHKSRTQRITKWVISLLVLVVCLVTILLVAILKTQGEKTFIFDPDSKKLVTNNVHFTNVQITFIMISVLLVPVAIVNALSTHQYLRKAWERFLYFKAQNVVARMSITCVLTIVRWLMFFCVSIPYSFINLGIIACQKAPSKKPGSEKNE